MKKQQPLIQVVERREEKRRRVGGSIWQMYTVQGAATKSDNKHGKREYKACLSHPVLDMQS